MTLNLMQASDQWATRPNDERFWSLSDMHAATLAHRNASTEVLRPMKDCNLTATDRGVAMEFMDGGAAEVSHYAFTQVCRQLGAPASYLRQLPSRLAVDCLNTNAGRLENPDKERNLLLDTSDPSRYRVRATTSDRYVRVWNHELVEALQGLESEGWVVPPARPTGLEDAGTTRIATVNDCIDFGTASPLTVKPGDEIAPAGLYASDHDMFAFLINPEIEIDNGLSPAGMRRGTMLRQSEVGACSIWKLDFLFDTVCGNHIVWDAREVSETRVRHMGSSVEDNWVAMVRNITEEAQMSAQEQEADIKRAQEIILGSGRDEIMSLLFKHRWATKRLAGSAFDAAEEHSELHGDPHSLWGMVSGMTRLSQKSKYADERASLDRAAGKMLAHCLN